jgi:hypothetical protein
MPPENRKKRGKQQKTTGKIKKKWVGNYEERRGTPETGVAGFQLYSPSSHTWVLKDGSRPRAQRVWAPITTLQSSHQFLEALGQLLGSAIMPTKDGRGDDPSGVRKAGERIRDWAVGEMDSIWDRRAPVSQL